MDKNFKNKFKNFFRKEGFYVVLFLCLCIIATVTTISYKISKQNQLKSQSSSTSANNKDLTLTEDDNIKNEIPNAERVEKNKTGNEATAKNDNDSESSAVSAPVAEVRFNKPVEGTVSREFSKTPIKFYETDSRVTYKTMNGIDIKATIGTEIKAAADGVIESVVNDDSKIGVEEGVNVTILHSNGLRTKYCNLDKNVLVKNNDKVTAGTVIGKIGSTAALYRKSAGEHLNLQVINSNGEQVDPLDYFSYK